MTTILSLEATKLIPQTFRLLAKKKKQSHMSPHRFPQHLLYPSLPSLSHHPFYFLIALILLYNCSHIQFLYFLTIIYSPSQDDVGFPSVYCKYALFLLVNKEAASAYDRTE